MLSLTASKPVPFGQRRRAHPALRFGLATIGSLAVIAAGSVFLSDIVSQAAAIVPPPRTDREVWYTPPSQPTVAIATELDIARSVPVKVAIPQPAPVASIYTHKIGVEALRVRSGPAKGNAQVFTLRGGTLVSVGGSQNGWTNIITQDGRSGWVFAKFLNPVKG
jgi:hypothetical protein